MDVKVPDFTKLHWQLNVALVGAAFSVFSLIYDDRYIYYGFLTFVYGVVGVTLMPAIENLDEKNKWRNFLLVQGMLTFIWIACGLFIVCWTNK